MDGMVNDLIGRWEALIFELDQKQTGITILVEGTMAWAMQYLRK